MEHPFTVDFYNVLIVVLAGFVRLGLALRNRARVKGSEFRFVKYFDNRHLVRWGSHIFTALVLALFVPELIIDYVAPKYFPEFKEWTFAGDFIIGFAGYDLIKAGEKKLAPLIKKIT